MKKLMMFAALFASLTLGACVDNEESASVTAVRNAYAEQLKSIAALNNADAQAAIIAANAEAQLKAAEAALKTAEAAKVAAETAYQDALTEAAKADALAAKAKAEQAIAEAELAAAKAAAELELYLLQHEATLAKTMMQLYKDIADMNDETNGIVSSLLGDYKDALMDVSDLEAALAEAQSWLAVSEGNYGAYIANLRSAKLELQNRNAEIVSEWLVLDAALQELGTSSDALVSGSTGTDSFSYTSPDGQTTKTITVTGQFESAEFYEGLVQAALETIAEKSVELMEEQTDLAAATSTYNKALSFSTTTENKNAGKYKAAIDKILAAMADKKSPFALAPLAIEQNDNDGDDVIDEEYIYYEAADGTEYKLFDGVVSSSKKMSDSKYAAYYYNDYSMYYGNYDATNAMTWFQAWADAVVASHTKDTTSANREVDAKETALEEAVTAAATIASGATESAFGKLVAKLEKAKDDLAAKIGATGDVIAMAGTTPTAAEIKAASLYAQVEYWAAEMADAENSAAYKKAFDAHEAAAAALAKAQEDYEDAYSEYDAINTLVSGTFDVEEWVVVNDDDEYEAVYKFGIVAVDNAIKNLITAMNAWDKAFAAMATDVDALTEWASLLFDENNTATIQVDMIVDGATVVVAEIEVDEKGNIASLEELSTNWTSYIANVDTYAEAEAVAKKDVAEVEYAIAKLEANVELYLAAAAGDVNEFVAAIEEALEDIADLNWEYANNNRQITQIDGIIASINGSIYGNPLDPTYNDYFAYIAEYVAYLEAELAVAKVQVSTIKAALDAFLTEFGTDEE